MTFFTKVKHLLSSLRLEVIVWWLLLVYPLLAVGADLGWVKREALKKHVKKNSLQIFKITFKGNMDESSKTIHQKLRVFTPSEPTVISLQS